MNKPCQEKLHTLTAWYIPFVAQILHDNRQTDYQGFIQTEIFGGEVGVAVSRTVNLPQLRIDMD